MGFDREVTVRGLHPVVRSELAHGGSQRLPVGDTADMFEQRVAEDEVCWGSVVAAGVGHDAGQPWDVGVQAPSAMLAPLIGSRLTTVTWRAAPRTRARSPETTEVDHGHVPDLRESPANSAIRLARALALMAEVLRWGRTTVVPSF